MKRPSLTALLIIITMVGIIGMFGYARHRATLLNANYSQWKEFQGNALKKVQLATALKREIGYDGFITNFRQAILRRNQVILDKAKSNLAVGKRVADQFTAYGLKESEIEILKSLGWLLHRYERLIEAAEASISASALAANHDDDLLSSLDDDYGQVSVEAFLDTTSNELERTKKQFEQTIMGTSTDLAFYVPGVLALFLLSSTIAISLMVSFRERASEKSERLKSEFLATVSHEIRTPLNGVLGMTELILNANPSKHIERYTRAILSSGESLLHIINDILDFSKIDAGKLELDPIPTNVADLVDEVGALFSVSALENAVEIAVRYVPGTPQVVIADATRLRQVVSNLVGNAVKFTEKGHILISVEEDRSVSLPRNKTQLVISVEDTGIGIAKTAHARMFDKFSQANGSTTRQYGGTGLGLSICKKLIELMDGEIGVESEEGAGAKFWFKVPFARCETSEAECVDVAELGKVRILTADDLPDVRRLFAEQLTAAGCRCDVAANGREALRMIREAYDEGVPYQIVTLNFQMPEMDGREVAAAVRQDERLNDTRLVMSSFNAKPLSDREFVDMGFSGFMAKPLRSTRIVGDLAHFWQVQQSGSSHDFVRLGATWDTKADTPEDFPYVKRGMSILVAEDNLVNQAFLQALLKEIDTRCVVVANGEEAVRRVTAEPFDLIIMDCLMPIMDGFDAAQAVRRLEKDNVIKDRLPILALTANAMAGDRDRCLAVGMDDYLSKPVRKKDLFRKIFALTSNTTGSGEDAAEDATAPDEPPMTDATTSEPLASGSEEQETSSAVLDLEAVDTARSVLKDKYDQMVSIYFDSSQERIREILNALEALDAGAIVRPAHTLKSSSMQMGAVKLSNLAKEIERSAREVLNDPGISGDKLQVISQSMKDVEAAFSETRDAFGQAAA